MLDTRPYLLALIEFDEPPRSVREFRSRGAPILVLPPPESLDNRRIPSWNIPSLNTF